MAPSILEQILINVKGGTLLPLDGAEPSDAEINAIVDQLLATVDGEIRRWSRGALQRPALAMAAQLEDPGPARGCSASIA